MRLSVWRLVPQLILSWNLIGNCFLIASFVGPESQDYLWWRSPLLASRCFALALLLIWLQNEERELKSFLSISRKIADVWSQCIDVGAEGVVLVIDILRPIDNVSPTRLGVRRTPGKEKEDVKLVKEFIGLECYLSHRRFVPILRCPRMAYYMEYPFWDTCTDFKQLKMSFGDINWAVFWLL